MTRRPTVLLLLAPLAVLAACGDSTSTPEDTSGSGASDSVGVVRVTVTASGTQVDSTLAIAVLYPTAGMGPNQPIALGQPVILRTQPGSAVVQLYDVDRNCSGGTAQPTARVNIVGGDTTDVRFDLRCVPKTFVRLAVETTGPDAPGSWVVFAPGIGWSIPQATGAAVVEVWAGRAEYVLRGVPANCSVTSQHPVTITVPEGGTGDVRFQVTCVALATTRVRARITGPVPAGLYIDVWGWERCDAMGCGPDWFSVPTDGGALEFRDPAGSRSVQLRLNVATRTCAVVSPNPVTVTTVSGQTTELVFDVACR